MPTSFVSRFTVGGVVLLVICCLTRSPVRAQDKNPPATPALPYHAYLPLIVNAEDPAVLAAALVVETAEELSAPWIDAAQAQANSLVSYTVAPTQDAQALGYPDSRKIVRDSQGALYVAYRRKPTSNLEYRIYVAQSTDSGRSWHELNGGQPIDTAGDYKQRVPSLAIDRQDRLYLAWYGNDSNNSGNQREIKFARSARFGAGWERQYTLDLPGYAGQTLWQEHPTLYVDGANVYIVWEGRDAQYRDKGQIKFLRSTNAGDSWTEWRNVQPSTTLSASRPTLVVSEVDSRRTLYLFAYRTNNGLAQIYWSRSPDNGDTWSSWVQVAGATADQRHLAVAQDRQARLHLVWRQVSKNRTIIRYRVYDPAAKQGTGAWGKVTTAAAVANRCLLFPTITVSGNDTLWVAWNQTDLPGCASVFAQNRLYADDPTTGHIGYTSKTANGTWANPVKLTTTGDHVYPSLRRANDPTATSGQIDLVWLEITGRTLSTGDEGKVEVKCPTAGCLIKWTTLGNW